MAVAIYLKSHLCIKTNKRQKKENIFHCKTIVSSCALYPLTSCLNRWLWEALVTHTEGEKKIQAILLQF